MQLSEKDSKRIQELVTQLEIVKDKYWILLAPFKKVDKKERKIVFLNLEQMNELRQLFEEERKMMDELISIPRNQP